MSPRDRPDLADTAPDKISSNGTTTTTTTTTTTHHTAAPPLVAQDYDKDYQMRESRKLAQTKVEKAREDHDMFNLYSLGFIIFCLLRNWDLIAFIRGAGLEGSWHETHIHFLLSVVSLYFVVDLAWVTSVPDSVKSPELIQKHHVVAFFYNAGAWYYPEFRRFYGLVLSVEVNTWFLIFRRVLYKRKDRTPAFIIAAVEVLFYSSWIAIRIIAYNYVLFAFLYLAAERVEQYGSYVQRPFVFIITHFFLCVLNLRWSWDLFFQSNKKTSSESHNL